MRDTRNWTDKYRPRHFGAVWGQQAAVDQLSNLIRSGKVEKHILLTGAVGSGKTTLAELYARSLNCTDNLSDGSPCGLCASCSDPRQYLYEYDAAGRASSNESIQALVSARNSRRGFGRTQVIFFDEAHGLSRVVQDGLLVAMQQAREGLVFIFATTEAKGLTPALMSRCLPIEINELDQIVAFEYLRFLAESENLSFEPAALRLLAAARPPYARDLVIGLEGLSVLDCPIDVSLVKAHYDLGVCDHLARYATALADGDQNTIADSLKMWRETALVKKRWIELFICSTYYNRVIGRGYVVNRLIECMPELQSAFVARLQSRLDLDLAGLEKFFEDMMQFFAAHGQCNEARAHLVIALFSKLVERGDGLRYADEPVTMTKLAHKAMSSHDQPTFQKDDRRLSAALDPQFLQTYNVRQLVNRASFFVQQYGTPFNAYVTVDLCASGPGPERHAKAFLREVIHAVEDRSTRIPGGLIATIERDGTRVVARILMCLEPNELPGLESWVAKYVPDFGSIRQISTCDDARDMALQWKAVRDMCAGCSPPADPHEVDVRHHLQIPKSKWRRPGPVNRPHLYVSACLSEDAIMSASYPEMPPLSPYDRGAFKWIPAGWEIKEFDDRTRERERRLALLARIRSDEGSGGNAEEALQNALQNWRQKSEHRLRHWLGWWS
jgi:energy-coupling factor transporter ATP-binding protein EcfA2